MYSLFIQGKTQLDWIDIPAYCIYPVQCLFPGTAGNNRYGHTPPQTPSPSVQRSQQAASFPRNGHLPLQTHSMSWLDLETLLSSDGAAREYAGILVDSLLTNSQIQLSFLQGGNWWVSSKGLGQKFPNLPVYRYVRSSDGVRRKRRLCDELTRFQGREISDAKNQIFLEELDVSIPMKKEEVEQGILHSLFFVFKNKTAKFFSFRSSKAKLFDFERSQYPSYSRERERETVIFWPTSTKTPRRY